MKPNQYLSLILFCALVTTTGIAMAQVNGLRDIEIIPAGKYTVQRSQTGQYVEPARQSLFPKIRRPNSRDVYEVTGFSSSVAATNCPTHVHNFYYSSNSEFQCPIISGGRTRIVSVHPQTGKPIEFFVMLAPGAPRVEYSKTGFTYVYKDHRTAIHFPKSLGQTPAVTVYQKNGVKLSDRVSQVIAKIQKKQTEIKQSSTVQSLLDLGKDGKESLAGAGVLADRTLGGTLDSLRQASSLLPGKSYLQSLSEQQAIDQRENSIRDTQRTAQGLGRFIRWPN